MLGGMMQSIGVGGTVEASELNLLTGNVGIGTASPTLTYGGKGLHIENNDNAEILLNDTTGATFSIAARDSDVLLYSANTDPIRIGVGGDEKMRIENTGNVGIGTVSPSAKLHVNGDVIFGEGSTLTIASGAITPTHAFHQVATESNASTDDLVTINGAYTGKMLILKALVTGKTIVLKDTGGNLRLAGGDFSMDNGNDLITLMGVGSIWYEISRSDNA